MIIYLFALTLIGTSFAHPHTSNVSFGQYFVHPNERRGDSIQGRIIGGLQAKPHEFPYQVGIYVNTVGGSAFCGGSLVSKRYVLTAAHCVDQALSADLIFGAQIIDANEDSQIKQFSQEFIVHSGWNRNQLVNDIAFIKLSQPIEENDSVKIIKIAKGPSTYEGENGVVAGWGTATTNQNGVSPVLRYVISTILTNEDCKKIDPYAGVIQSGHLCLSGSSGNVHVGTCNGDSGGPLSLDGIQIGLVSFGYKDCEAGKPSVFTRLTEFTDWIERNSDVVV